MTFTQYCTIIHLSCAVLYSMGPYAITESDALFMWRNCELNGMKIDRHNGFICCTSFNMYVPLSSLLKTLNLSKRILYERLHDTAVEVDPNIHTLESVQEWMQSWLSVKYPPFIVIIKWVLCLLQFWPTVTLHLNQIFFFCNNYDSMYLKQPKSRRWAKSVFLSYAQQFDCQF